MNTKNCQQNGNKYPLLILKYDLEWTKLYIFVIIIFLNKIQKQQHSCYNGCQTVGMTAN